MARSVFDQEKPLESFLKPDTFLYWQGHTYRILSRDLREVRVLEDESTSLVAEPRTIRVVDLAVPEGESPPVFAPTKDKLRQMLEELHPPPPSSADADLPQALRDKAALLVRKYQAVVRLLAQKKDDLEKAGEAFRRVEALKEICRSQDIKISLATFYNYHDIYEEFSGNRAAIAASLRRMRSFGHTRLTDAQQFFVDSAIVKYYMRRPRLRKATLYEQVIKPTYRRTNGLWIDPRKGEGDVPQDLVDQLFDDKLPMQAILDNPEKRRWLVPIDEPHRTWVYERIGALEKRPDEGKAIIVARYGEEMWDHEQMIFDHFAHIATRPLQYVFADYCLLKVFIVDRETRSELDRLWLVLLIDAYSRSVVGWTLTYEQPCIDSMQDALLNAIWPKTSHAELGIEGEWPCYGIPLQLSLDNAWSNHSHSLESLASLISMKGEYNSIDLVFRKPYRARQGALIERFFGRLAALIKERLKGAIQSSHPRDIRNAAEEACLIVTAVVDKNFNVGQRLTQMRSWRDEWREEDERLRERLRQLDRDNPLDQQRGEQIGRLRKRLKARRVREPLEIVIGLQENDGGQGYRLVRRNLAAQFAALPKEDRLMWLDNFLFIMTPDLWRLHKKVKNVLAYTSLGQQRNFLLGGHSGMGKTTYLNWLSALNPQIVEEQRNYVPVIKVDAPVSNITPKSLLRRMLLDCGLTYLKGDGEEDLLMKLDLYLQQCGVKLIIVDEIEHISRPDMRRRLLDISNMTQGIPIICASCNPTNWTIGDVEVAGRWNDYFELPQYLGERLSDLLAFIETLLPFTQESHLALRMLRAGTETVDGPAKLIQQWTGGILRDIMILIRDASQRAIENDLPCLTPSLLEQTWKEIQTRRVTDFSSETDQDEG